MSRRSLLHLVAVFCFAFFPARLLAQNDDMSLAPGFTPYQSFHGGDIDSINVTNGNLIIRIPLISYPQRGGKLSLSFSVIMNGKLYAVQQDCTPGDICYYRW